MYQRKPLLTTKKVKFKFVRDIKSQYIIIKQILVPPKKTEISHSNIFSVFLPFLPMSTGLE